MIVPDPRLQFMYPDESPQQAERRVKLESAMVKVYGEQVDVRSWQSKLFGQGTYWRGICPRW